MTVELTGNFLVTGFATTNKANDTLLLAGTAQAGYTGILPRQAGVGMTVNIDSPLVVYGDTTQDGIWYAGKPYQSSSLGKFSDKPQPHMDNVQFKLATPSGGLTNPSLAINGGSLLFGTFSNADGTFGTIKRTDGGDWRNVAGGAGFIVDGLITIDGVAVGEVTSLTSDTLTVTGMTPAFGSVAAGSHTVQELNSASVKLSGGQQFDPASCRKGWSRSAPPTTKWHLPAAQAAIRSPAPIPAAAS
jgi:hypothetical protein